MVFSRHFKFTCQLCNAVIAVLIIAVLYSILYWFNVFCVDVMYFLLKYCPYCAAYVWYLLRSVFFRKLILNIKWLYCTFIDEFDSWYCYVFCIGLVKTNENQVNVCLFRLHWCQVSLKLLIRLIITIIYFWEAKKTGTRQWYL